jgi:hypothetical protein
LLLATADEEKATARAKAADQLAREVPKGNSSIIDPSEM